MKFTYFTIFVLLFIGQLTAQKGQSSLVTNLNSSRSNVYRLIYPVNMFTSPNARLLLNDLEKTNLTDLEEMKKWLASNFKKYGDRHIQIRQISFFKEQTKACKACYLKCKGVCVPEPGNEKEGCLCISIYGAAPDTNKMVSEISVTIIFLSTEILDDATILDQVQRTIKGTKSNSDN